MGIMTKDYNDYKRWEQVAIFQYVRQDPQWEIAINDYAAWSS